MAWACMTAPGKGTPIFIDDVIHDDSRRMNPESRNILSANLQRKKQLLCVVRQ